MDTDKGFEVPNHTQTPNTFFDVVMPQIKSIAELKVILAITRQTFGWQKRFDRISMSQLQRLTGLTHQGVQNGIVQALAHGFIQREAVGQSFIYGLKLVKQIDQSSKLTSQVSRPKPVKQIDQEPVYLVDTQKKVRKEIKESKERQQRGARLPDDFCLNSEMREWAALNTPHVDLKTALAEFRDYWVGVPGARGQKLDWIATWRNRMRDIEARVGRNGNAATKASGYQTANERRAASFNGLLSVVEELRNESGGAADEGVRRKSLTP